MASRIGQEIRLKQYPTGMPTKDIFDLAKVNVPEPKEGEFLVRNIWMSIVLYQSNPYEAANTPANIAKLAKHAAAIIYHYYWICYTKMFLIFAFSFSKFL